MTDRDGLWIFAAVMQQATPLCVFVQSSVKRRRHSAVSRWRWSPKALPPSTLNQSSIGCHHALIVVVWVIIKSVIKRSSSSSLVPPSTYHQHSYGYSAVWLRHARLRFLDVVPLIVFTRLVSTHGCCHILLWLIEFSGAVLSCCTFSYYTLFSQNYPTHNRKTRQYHSSEQLFSQDSGIRNLSILNLTCFLVLITPFSNFTASFPATSLSLPQLIHPDRVLFSTQSVF